MARRRYRQTSAENVATSARRTSPLGDASIQLAGELADGWSPFMYPRRELSAGVERLREGAPRERVLVVSPSVPAVVAEDPARARDAAAFLHRQHGHAVPLSR